MDKPEAASAPKKKIIKRKPMIVYVLSTLYFLDPLLSVFQANYYRRDLNIHDALMMAMYPVVGWGILRMKWWGWYLIIAHVTMLLVNNAILALMFEDVDPLLLAKLSVLLVLVLVFFLQRQVRLPYHNSALRYWERQSPHYDVTFRCRIQVPGFIDEPIETSAVNISMSGIYVVLPRESHLTRGNTVLVDVDYAGIQVRLTGKTAWTGDGTGATPYGVGVQFGELDRATHKGLSQLVRVIKNEWRAAHKSKAVRPA